MPKTFRNPRMIAEATNRPDRFARDAEFDAVSGTPAGVSQSHSARDYSAQITNPPEKPVPAKNLKR